MGDPFATMGNVTPSTAAIAHEVVAAVIAAGLEPPHTIWGMGGPPEHSTGNAIDLMVPLNSPSGDFMADYIWANGERFALNWVIWKQRIRNPGRGDGWTGMEDRGNTTQNHYDHVHAFFRGDGSTDGVAQAAIASNPDATPLPTGGSPLTSSAPGGGGAAASSAPTSSGPTGTAGSNQPIPPEGTTAAAGGGTGQAEAQRLAVGQDADAQPFRQVEVVVADLRADAGHYASVQQSAAALATSFRSLAEQAVDWGLHGPASGGLTLGATRFADRFARAAQELGAVQDGLLDTADDYAVLEQEAGDDVAAKANRMEAGL